jgi:hypothetical protein
MKRFNDGSTLENATWKALASIQENDGGFAYRFADSKAAGNLIGAAPGDYLLVLNGRAVLIECKSTVSGTTLRSLIKGSQVGKRQLAKHRLWLRGGGVSLYLHYDLAGGVLSAYEGEVVVDSILFESSPPAAFATGNISQIKTFITRSAYENPIVY